MYMSFNWMAPKQVIRTNFEKNNGIVLVPNKWHFPQPNVILHESATDTQMTNHSTYKMYIEWEH